MFSFRQLLLPAALAIVFGSADRALAIKPFKDAFEAKYLKSDSKAPADVALAAAIKDAKCGVCHGASKKDRNAYGTALDKLLDKATDKANAKKIAEALDAVAKQRIKGDDPASPTFGDLFAQGKLPK